MGIGHLGRPDHLLVGGVLLGVPDVVKDSSGKQKILLQHHSDLAVELFQHNISDVHPVYQYGAVVHLVQVHEQIDHGGLSRAGGPYQTDHLPL